MAKSIQKQFFTEDLSKYKCFLEASDVNIKASIATMQQEIDVHKKICALIQKYKTEKHVDPEDIAGLVKTSCPDFVTLNTFEKLNGNPVESLDELLEMPTEEIVMDCSKTRCEICWKNYINQMARLLNRSFVEVKYYEPTEDKDDVNSDHEN